eukprot:5919472-Amphidinium_carterae.1
MRDTEVRMPSEALGGDSKRARLQSVLAVVHESSVVDQEARTSFIQHEVLDEQGPLKETGLIGSLDEISEWLACKPEDLKQTRLEEIEKLQMFSVFKPVRAVDVPSTARVFKYVWVDTNRGGKLKSRITCRDLKVTAVKKERELK